MAGDGEARAPRGILSVQSSVVYGHVGNSAAVFPLQLLGFEVWQIDTVQFSNHPAHGGWRGRITEPGLVAELLEGLAERGLFAQCAAVLSGYLGDAATGEVLLAALPGIKSANPRALYCCDPVIGDTGHGVYVRPGLPEFFRDRAVAAADIVTPNRFELEYLTGRPAATLDEALSAADALRRRGPKIVLTTSLERPDAPASSIEMLVVTADGAWLVATPRLPIAGYGTGDAVAALFLGHYLNGGDAGDALAEAAAAIFAVAETTQRSGGGELALIAARAAILEPPRRFASRRVR